MPPETSPQHPHRCTHENEFGVLAATMSEIKDTLRDLKDLLTSNAILEERTEALRQQGHGMEKRLQRVEITVAKWTGSSKWVERLVWLAVTGALTGGVFVIKG